MSLSCKRALVGFRTAPALLFIRTVWFGISSRQRHAYYRGASLAYHQDNSVTSIGDGAFYNCSSLIKVYYKGTADDWTNISIDSSNSRLINATRYYYSETQPTASGNYWHYDGDGNVVEW